MQLSEKTKNTLDFFENADVAVHLVNRKGIIQWANRSEFSWLGYKPEEYIGKENARFYSSASEAAASMKILIEGRPLAGFGASRVRKDGSKLPVMLYSNSYQKSGEFQHTRCFTIPENVATTESTVPGSIVAEGMGSKAWEEGAAEVLDDLFENAPVALHMVGANGTIERANKIELELLGYSDAPEKYVGHHISEFHADKSVIEDILERLLNNRAIFGYSAWLLHRDGSKVGVKIFSNSRMENGKFLNTRCFTFPSDGNTAEKRTRFSWPS